MKIYTKNGDRGKTALVDGTAVAKSDTRLDTYGGVDELNSHIGLLNTHAVALGFSEDVLFLTKVQNQLFDLGSQLACSDEALQKKLPQVFPSDIQNIESEIDRLSASLPPLKNFILPGGHLCGAQAHVCRTVCRRVERDCVRFFGDMETSPIVVPFLNRLSDYFFVLSRAVNHRLSVETPAWTAGPTQPPAP